MNANSAPKVRVIDNGNAIALTWPDQTSRFHAIWLRDNGQDENTRNSANQQKLFRVQDIPTETLIQRAEVNNNQLEIVFSPDQWRTRISLDWLKAFAYDRPEVSANENRLFDNEVTVWDAKLGNNIPTDHFTNISQSDSALLAWLKAINRYGVATLTGLPNKNAAILDVIDLFGYVRETNYGEYFEIRSELNPTNLAYTSLGLQSHTDNPYRDPVPGLQFFGCLENNADGGESVVVDGFAVAKALRIENTAWFELLCNHRAQFEYNGSVDTHLRSNAPMIGRDVNGIINRIQFNNRSCHALTDIPYDEMQDYYQAYRRFSELVSSAEFEVVFKLAPGELFVTDNTRVLHGRTGFSGAGTRWMQGAYADKDSLQSKIRVLENTLKEK